MKKFKKVLTSILTVAVMGSLCITPTTTNALAIVLDPNSTDEQMQERCKYYEENSLKPGTELIFDVTDGEYSAVYYLKVGCYHGYPINITDEEFIELGIDISNIETRYITENMTSGNGFIQDFGSYYTTTSYDFYAHAFLTPLSRIEKLNTVDDGDTDTTVGESDDTTVGDSETTPGDSNNLYDEPTNIRGDVNYDGKVNVIDVMTLRRYLLHLLEW